MFDVFSRMPLSAAVFRTEPRAKDLAKLVKRTAAVSSSPRHFVSDQGTQFTAAAFRAPIKKLGIRQRFGAIAKAGSIALIERFWRTLKDLLCLRTLRLLVIGDLRRRLELGLFYYAYLRPHQALGGATPAEIYFASTPVHLAAVHPPRGKPGQGPREPPFQIAYLDPERLLPILLKKAA